MTHNQPTFSIVTVSFNCRDQIEKTMKSVMQQSYAGKEYIVIDGGSTDGTAEIIKSHSENLAYWCSEPDGGIYQGMNKGISRAKGDWIIFMNAGDTFADNQVLEHTATYAQKGKYDVIYGDILKIIDGETVLKTASEPCNKQRMYFCHQAAFARTTLMREMPFDTRFPMSADLHFFKRCYLSGHKFLHIPVTVAVYDSHGVSNTQRIKGLRDNVRVVKELDKGSERRKFLLKLYYVIYWNSLRNFVKSAICSKQ